MLFEQAKTPVQVAIKLETQEVDRLYKEFWMLKGLYELNEIYVKSKDDIFSFFKLYQFAKKEGMAPQQVINTSKIGEQMGRVNAPWITG